MFNLHSTYKKIQELSNQNANNLMKGHYHRHILKFNEAKHYSIQLSKKDKKNLKKPYILWFMLNKQSYEMPLLTGNQFIFDEFKWENSVECLFV